jgi:hypothetical protein
MGDEPHDGEPRRGILTALHDNLKLISGIVVAVAAIVTSVIGVMQLRGDSDQQGDGDIAAYCQDIATFDAQMAGTSFLLDDPEQLTQDMMRNSRSAAAHAPSDIAPASKELYAAARELDYVYSTVGYNVELVVEKEAELTAAAEDLDAAWGDISVYVLDRCPD